MLQMKKLRSKRIRHPRSHACGAHDSWIFVWFGFFVVVFLSLLLPLKQNNPSVFTLGAMWVPKDLYNSHQQMRGGFSMC